KQGAERKAQWELIKEMLGGGITPAGTPGVSKLGVTNTKGGGLPELTMSVTPEAEAFGNLFGQEPLSLGSISPTQGQPGQQASAPKELADISPFSTSPGSISAADLTGLTPDQILAVMQEQREVDKMKTGTFMEAMGLLGMPFKPTDQFITLTDGLGRIFTQNMATGELKQVSGPPPTKPLTFEEQKALKQIPTDIPRGDWWKNPETNDSKWVAYGTNPPPGYTQRVPSREREVSDLPERQFGFTKERTATTAAQNIRLMPKRDVVKGDIEFYNRNSSDAATSGFFWRSEKKKWAADINEATEVPLPVDKSGIQVTMADVRAEAAERQVSPETVLEEIYKWMEKQEK
ncbi:MAG: hypothetical protein KKD77_23325, partial [Gammaproteobacteria bacterium]|nr:hypothetical protein [Gammaproteobacteria bacterium]